MYFYVFSLFLLHYLLITEVPPTLGARNILERLWPKIGGGRLKPVDQSHEVPRRKRTDEIDPSVINNKYVEDEFYGVRSDAIILIENEGKYGTYDLKYAYGVRLQSKLVLTICSAVTYVEEETYRVTYSFHPQKRVPVKKCDVRDIKVKVMSSYYKPETSIDRILIHPLCDNQLMVDIAVLVTAAPLPDSRNVWIHTAENLIFRRNLDRAVAAQAVLGKCTVPIYRKRLLVKKPVDRKVAYTVDYARVQFQHWDGCEPNVCPYWDTSEDDEFDTKFQDPFRCHNQLNGTRYCMAWQIPEKLCALYHGTPVFCDVGHIHGLMGFVLRETYNCWMFHDKSVVMQGMTDAIRWIRETLTIRFSDGYEESIPDWMKNLRRNYTSGYIPRIEPSPRPIPSLEVTFNQFAGHQILSVVNVYHQNQFMCRGTLVTNNMAILPCSCITYNPSNMTELENIRNEGRVSFYQNYREFTISLMIDGSFPRTTAYTFLPNPKCRNHYSYDSAMIKLDAPYLKNNKVAWVMTPQEDIFKKMLTIMAVADSSMGYNCYWINNEVPYDRRTQFRKQKIRFVPWTKCVDIVCPSEQWRALQKDRCYGPTDPAGSATLFCIESNWNAPPFPACAITHGTPIFCNVEEARGFIGFVSKAMDLHETPCREREIENQTAVLQGLDNILPQIADGLWIHAFEELYRESEPRRRGSSPKTVTSFLITSVIAISFIV